MNTLIIAPNDIREIVTHIGLDTLMDRMIQRLEEALLSSSPCFDVPQRAGFKHDAQGLLEWMPVMATAQSATVKIVSYNPRQPSVGLPTIVAYAARFNPSTGQMRCLMDATFLTALRTGAASAVASRVLARTDSSILAVIGAGAQAVSQIHALARLFPLQQVRAYDTNPLVASTLAQRLKPVTPDLNVVACANAQDAVANADIVCTATSVELNAPPVITADGLHSHVHINAVGSDFPGKCELPLGLLKHAFVAVDHKPQAKVEGECQQLAEHDIGPDFFQLVQGSSQYDAYRDRVTVFDSTGFAMEDHIALDLLMEIAAELNLGQEQEIAAVSQQVESPYAFLYETNGSV